MEPTYNRVTGQSVERLAAISDEIFAFAMTFLVLDLHGPVKEAIHSEQNLWMGLGAKMPQLVTWIMSFLTLGIFWAGQQAQLNRFERSDPRLTWIHLFFLCAVTVIPFSTRLLADFISFRTALLVYWANIVVLGLILYLSWRHAEKRHFIKAEAPLGIGDALKRRIVVAQALYAAGAFLCIFNPYVSIAFIVLAQLNFVFSPPIPWLRRI